MAVQTAFTELAGVRHPVVLAPMAGCSGGGLAAAVSNGGGLGLVGAGRGDAELLDRELALAAERTALPWGVGFLTWATEPAAVRRALEYRPAAVLFSFGDPAPYAELVKSAGALLLVQVTDLAEARQALAVGADAVVAQGTEAGGHGGRRATLPFVPAVADLAGSTPVLAAGGIADGRGLAAALALGAAGVLVGTRFQATPEALVPDAIAKALVDGCGDDTERSRIIDIARGAAWPDRYTGRSLRNAFLDRWRDAEAELRGSEAAKEEYRTAAARGDLDVVPVWAGEGVDLITGLRSAADLVTDLVADAEQAIARMTATRH